MTNLILISTVNITIPAVISFVITTTQMMDFDKAPNGFLNWSRLSWMNKLVLIPGVKALAFLEA